MTVHHLPQPPSDDELYWYFGPQRRWVLVSSSLAFVFTAATMFTFALRTPALWAFLAVLGLNVVALLLSSANSLRQRRLTRASHDVLVRAWRPAALPTVDLYLPTCGEPLPVLANAYRAVAALDWPDALTVWVLDDADRAEVAALAAEHGYRYVVRPDRGHLEEGGEPQPRPPLSDAEFIAILDADFAPRPDFLRHLVPYFADPAVGIVQSPQCFDTDAGMDWIQRAAGAAQEWFFRWIQPSLGRRRRRDLLRQQRRLPALRDRPGGRFRPARPQRGPVHRTRPARAGVPHPVRPRPGRQGHLAGHRHLVRQPAVPVGDGQSAPPRHPGAEADGRALADAAVLLRGRRRLPDHGREHLRRPAAAAGDDVRVSGRRPALARPAAARPAVAVARADAPDQPDPVAGRGDPRGRPHQRGRRHRVLAHPAGRSAAWATTGVRSSGSPGSMARRVVGVPCWSGSSCPTRLPPRASR